MWIPTAVVAEQWPRRAMELVAVAIARVEVVGAREGHLPNQAVPVLEAMMIRATGHVNTAPSPIRSQLPFVRCVSSVGKSLLEGESTILFIGRDQVLSLLAFCLAGYMWRKTGLLYFQSSLRGMNLSEKGKEWRVRKVKWVGKQKEITSRICKSVMFLGQYHMYIVPVVSDVLLTLVWLMSEKDSVTMVVTYLLINFLNVMMHSWHSYL